jgi:hypothetical protein
VIDALLRRVSGIRLPASLPFRRFPPDPCSSSPQTGQARVRGTLFNEKTSETEALMQDVEYRRMVLEVGHVR